MNIPGLTDLVTEIREGRHVLFSLLDGIREELREANNLLAIIAENTEPEEAP